jgi:hypothetical protein
MSFLNPWAFLGLLSLPAIIALHWHFERQRRVIVSSMFLWRFLDEKFQGRKMSFLHITWLLILDLLIALLLTLALTRPVLALPVLGSSEHQLTILLDDSASMLALDGASDRFTNAKQLAASLIEDSGPKDQIALITFGGTSELVGISTGKEAESLANQARQLSPIGRGEDFRAGLAAALRLVDEQLPQVVYVITDAAFTLPPLEDFPLEITWLLLGEGDNNQAILDLDVESGIQAQSNLFFRIANYSSVSTNRQLEVKVDGQVVSTIFLELPPDSIIPQTFSLTGAGEYISVKLLGLDNMPADDSAVLGVIGDTRVKVAVVADNPYPLDRAILTIPGTDLDVYPTGLLLNEIEYDLIIYRGTVPDRWPAGTVLVFDPPPTTSVIPVGTPVEVADQLSIAHGSILEGLGLDSVRWEFASVFGKLEYYNEIATAGDLPFVLRWQTDLSDVYIFAPLLASGNFTKHPAFPILLSRFVSLARDFTPNPAYLAGDQIVLPDGEITLEYPSGKIVESIVAQQLELSESGLYTFTVSNPIGGVRESVFGVNLGEEEESDIARREWSADIASIEEEVDRSWQRVEVDLGPWLLGFSVILLLIEAWRAWR